MFLAQPFSKRLYIVMSNTLKIRRKHTNNKSTNNKSTNNKSAKNGRQAIAVFDGEKIKGTVYFTEINNRNDVKIDIKLTGLSANALHGFHVHESGDMSEKCESMCAHFNPFHKTHGKPGMKQRHVGDLGNLKTDATGEAQYTMRDNIIKLRGEKANIIGRGLIIHADEDDCGHGSNEASLINGNAGKRIACAIIGYSKKNCSK
jgi:Cu-Zn family superoxide dismutase